MHTEFISNQGPFTEKRLVNYPNHIEDNQDDVDRNSIFWKNKSNIFLRKEFEKTTKAGENMCTGALSLSPALTLRSLFTEGLNTKPTCDVTMFIVSHRIFCCC